jgi:prolyl-tRNA synthetase
MRFSRMLLPTLKESPSDAEVISQKLMMRSGMISKVAAGVYNLLPLGVRVLKRVEAIVRAEMDSSGAQELLMPFVIPAELWKESGRWDEYGAELLRLNDRHGREFCLGPTHEEVITDIARRSIRSYRDLPKNLYQMQIKFRDEIRPRFGLMRCREFVMKDAYSFHADDESAELEYRNMYDTYRRIFERCGLSFRAVEAESGAIGGSFSHEFMVMADTGEDAIASCDKCDYAANLERAEIGREKVQAVNEADAKFKEKGVEEVRTPGKKSVEEVSEFLKVKPSELIKTLIYETGSGVVAALVRGDAELNELKLKRVLGADFVRLADDGAVEAATGAPSGFAGPVGLKIKIYADHGVEGITSGVTGANKADMHIRNVSASRDFSAVYADLRSARDGDVCPTCQQGVLKIMRGIEVGHIFKLGSKYSESMGATFLDDKGKQRPMIMGCYGIGIGRTAAAAIEQNHDEAGIIWPAPLAPFDCEVLAVNVKKPEVVKEAERIYGELKQNGLEVLFDDRDERAGVKFKDADLIGIPLRVVVGERNLAEGMVEVKERRSGEVRLVKVADVAVEVESSLPLL